MANQERGEVDLVARDRTYTLVLTTNGACALEAAAGGRSLDEIVAGTLQSKVVDMRWLIWAALQEHHAAEIATPQDAGRLIDDAGGLRVVWHALNTFVDVNADHSEKAGSATAPDPLIAQRAATGSDSTSMPAASG